MNNAGILDFAPDPARRTSRRFRRVIDVNLVGTMHRHEDGRAVDAQGRRRLDHQHLVQRRDRGACRRSAPTCRASGRVRGLSKTAAIELGKHGIRVNSVHPGGIDTPMTRFGAATRRRRLPFAKSLPIPRIGHVDEVANVVTFLASDEAATSPAPSGRSTAAPRRATASCSDRAVRLTPAREQSGDRETHSCLEPRAMRTIAGLTLAAVGGVTTASIALADDPGADATTLARNFPEASTNTFHGVPGQGGGTNRGMAAVVEGDTTQGSAYAWGAVYGTETEETRGTSLRPTVDPPVLQGVEAGRGGTEMFVQPTWQATGGDLLAGPLHPATVLVADWIRSWPR